MLSLLQKKRIDFYLGMPLLLLLRPVVKLVGLLLRRDHTAESKGRILVLKFLGGGSLLMAYPALLGIRNRYPRQRLILVTTKSVSEFGHILGIFDEVIEIDDSNLYQLLPSGLRALCRSFLADTILDLEVFSRFSTLFSLLTCARNRVTLVCDDVFLRRHIATHLVYFNRFAGQYLFYDQMALIIGARAASIEQCREKLRASLSEIGLGTEPVSRPRLFIGHGCSEHLKERVLTKEQWRVVFEQRLPRKHFDSILFLGSALDRASAEDIISYLEPLFPGERFTNLCGDYKLPESAALLSTPGEFWGIDSSLIHFARLQGIKTLSFWGPTAPTTRLRPVPNLDEEICYKQIYCSPCVHASETPPCGGNNLCVQGLFRLVTEEELERNTLK